MEAAVKAGASSAVLLHVGMLSIRLLMAPCKRQRAWRPSARKAAAMAMAGTAPMLFADGRRGAAAAVLISLYTVASGSFVDQAAGVLCARAAVYNDHASVLMWGFLACLGPLRRVLILQYR